MYTIEDIYKDIKEGMSLEKIHKRYGGFSIYIPKNRPDFKERIIEEFNGCNQIGLAHKYNVSLNTIYKILREHREGKSSE